MLGQNGLVPTIAAAVAFGLAYVAFQFLLNCTDLSQRIKRKGFYGCPHYRHSDILWGSDYAEDLNDAARRGERTGRVRQNFDRLGNTYEINSKGRRIFQTRDPVNSQCVLSTQFAKFGLGTTRSLELLGEGIMTRDGEIWRSSREQLKPIFLKAQISDLGRLEKHLTRFMHELARRDYEADLQPLFIKMYLGYSIDLLFGDDVKVFEDESSKLDVDEFIDACDKSLLRIVRLRTPWLLRWWRGWEKDHEMPYKISEAFVDRYVDAALEAAQDNEAASDRSTAFIDQLVHQTGSTDRVYLRKQMLNIFFPARDTSGIMISIIIFHLARNPEVYAKVRAEVLASSAADSEVTYDTVKNLRFTNAVVNESLRLFSPASSLHREVLADAVLPRGGGVDGTQPFFLPKGSAIVVHMHAMQRDQKAWGSDADEFRPERWLEASKSSQRRAWEYLPFSGGPRICPAQAMVVAQMAYILVRFAVKFREIRNLDPEERLLERHNLLMSIQNGVRVKLVT